MQFGQFALKTLKIVLQDTIIKQTLIFIYSFQCADKQIPAYSTSCHHKMPLAEIVPLNSSKMVLSFTLKMFYAYS